MPAEHPLDPNLLDAVAGALTRSGGAALEASHELLAHYSDTGDAPTQRAVDTLIDHAADALRSLTDSLADLSGEVQAAAIQATTHHAASARFGDADGPSAHPGRRRDHLA
jgi:hypothetical protein